MKKFYEAVITLLLVIFIFALIIFSGCSAYPKHKKAQMDHEEIRFFINNPGWSLGEVSDTTIDDSGNLFINNNGSPVEKN